MNYEIEKYKEIYNNTYEKNKNYNFHNLVKDIYVDVYAAYVNGKILDAGCGEGIHLKRMLANGHDAFGIELSNICCEKYLRDVPHENNDILGFSKKARNFDGLICMDVLEHISYENIDDTIYALSQMSRTAFIGIANHSDVINGVELHLIQKDSCWWISVLSKYYKTVRFVSQQFDGKFYYIYCSNNELEDKFYNEVNNILKSCIVLDDERICLYNNQMRLTEELNRKSMEYINKICELNRELENIKTSRGYKLIVKYRKWRDKMKEIFL